MTGQNHQIDWQGHRGCRGLMPENTIPAFLKAIELGVSTLEMDIVVSKDKQIIVSHEPWMSHVICSKPGGSPVGPNESNKLNIYQMTKEEIQKYDCGKRVHPKFPQQKKIEVYKPTLDEVVVAVNNYCDKHQLPIPQYNLELKSHPEGYEVMVPNPVQFVMLVIDKIRILDIESRTTLQSFDLNILEELNLIKTRSFKISLLSDNKKSLINNLERLTFRPDIYSPHHRMVKKKMVQLAHHEGLLVIPWTVNKKKRIKKLIKRKVDGIITDYPNLISLFE